MDQQILDQGLERVVNGNCGEGKAWARGLIADCRYRIALSYKDMDMDNESLKEFEKHLYLRGPGCRFIYPLKNIRKEYNKLKKR